jgi:hypothetical protein
MKRTFIHFDKSCFDDASVVGRVDVLVYHDPESSYYLATFNWEGIEGDLILRFQCESSDWKIIPLIQDVLMSLADRGEDYISPEQLVALLKEREFDEDKINQGQ